MKQLSSSELNNMSKEDLAAMVRKRTTMRTLTK